MRGEEDDKMTKQQEEEHSEQHGSGEPAKEHGAAQ